MVLGTKKQIKKKKVFFSLLRCYIINPKRYWHHSWIIEILYKVGFNKTDTRSHTLKLPKILVSLVEREHTRQRTYL